MWGRLTTIAINAVLCALCTAICLYYILFFSGVQVNCVPDFVPLEVVDGVSTDN